MICIDVKFLRMLTVVLVLTVSNLLSVSAQQGESAESEISMAAKSTPEKVMPRGVDGQVQAQPPLGNVVNGYDDNIEVSLLTCDPSDEVYGLYGHTAIRYHNLKTGEDWAFNYGIFSFAKPFFILRFTLGFTDYELGVTTFEFFKRAYASRGVRVREQVLNLTPREKDRLFRDLAINYLPENRVYRYNCYYDNCTTRARDIIEQSIGGGKIIYGYASEPKEVVTYRKLIHESNAGHPWARFGVDLCMGLGSDLPICPRKAEFLPKMLLEHFDNTHIEDEAGERPMVKETRIAVEGYKRPVEKEFPLTPLQCSITLLVVSLIIMVVEIATKKVVKAWDVVLMTAQGLSGILIVLLFLSQHPTTSTNLQILILNPLPLFFIPAVILAGRKRKRGGVYSESKYWTILFGLLVLYLFGAFFQHYAEGMGVVALSLLTRCLTHHIAKVRSKRKSD